MKKVNNKGNIHKKYNVKLCNMAEMNQGSKNILTNKIN